MDQKSDQADTLYQDAAHAPDQAPEAVTEDLANEAGQTEAEREQLAIDDELLMTSENGQAEGSVGLYGDNDKGKVDDTAGETRVLQQAHTNEELNTGAQYSNVHQGARSVNLDAQQQATVETGISETEADETLVSTPELAPSAHEDIAGLSLQETNGSSKGSDYGPELNITSGSSAAPGLGTASGESLSATYQTADVVQSSDTVRSGGGGSSAVTSESAGSPAPEASDASETSTQPSETETEADTEEEAENATPPSTDTPSVTEIEEAADPTPTTVEAADPTTITGTEASETLTGSDGEDWLYGGDGNDVLYGGDGDDRLFGGQTDEGSARVSISSLLEDDGYAIKTTGVSDGRVRLTSMGRSENTEGDTGNVFRIRNGTDEDKTLTLKKYGSSEEYTINVPANSEFFQVTDGSGGTFVLQNEAGRNIQTKSAGGHNFSDGHKVTVTTDGADTLFGGDGQDTAVFTGDHSDYTITFDAEADTFTVTDSMDDRDGITALSEIETLEFNDIEISTDQLIAGTAEGDILTGDGLQNALFGGAGDDWIYGGSGDDIIEGGTGEDTLAGGAGDDTLFGGADNDLFDLSGGGNDVASGGTGWDTIALDGAETFVQNGVDTAARGEWTVEFDEGGFAFDGNYQDLLDNSAGTITLLDTMETISFDGMEKFDF